MRKSKQILILFALAIVISSCDSSVLYEEQQDIKGQAWNKDRAISFSYQADTILSNAVKFSFNVRHNVDYAYRNMWMFVNISIPNREPIIDTINLEFMDYEGNWLKHVEGGTIKESRHDYRYALPNAPKGLYKIELKQGMRGQQLDNIVSIGARIEKLNYE